jgi:hypothetical protein
VSNVAISSSPRVARNASFAEDNDHSMAAKRRPDS